MTTLQYATAYTLEQVERARKTLLHVGDVLGDFLDEIVLVGGLVPMYLVNQDALPEGLEPHIGSIDVDLGLSFAVVTEERYDDLAERLRSADFEPDTNDKGNLTRQRWHYKNSQETVKIDFLIGDSEVVDKQAGQMFDLTHDLGAIVIPGLDLALDDFVEIMLRGENLLGDHVAVTIHVCGPAPFVVLKALARKKRNKPGKDAYDLDYVLAGVEEGPRSLGAKLRARSDHRAVQEAIEELEANFAFEQSVGPRQASRFLHGDILDEYVADIVGRVSLFLRGFKEGD